MIENHLEYLFKKILTTFKQVQNQNRIIVNLPNTKQFSL